MGTDFTRTGVRTHWGVLQDGWNSAIRYVKNNFKDGQRTDGIKFLIGELSTNDLVDVETSKRRNLANSEPSLFPYLPYGLLVVSFFYCGLFFSSWYTIVLNLLIALATFF